MLFEALIFILLLSPHNNDCSFIYGFTLWPNLVGISLTMSGIYFLIVATLTQVQMMATLIIQIKNLQFNVHAGIEKTDSIDALMASSCLATLGGASLKFIVHLVPIVYLRYVVGFIIIYKP